MQLIAALYKGLFISQRVTKGALSTSSLGLLNHHPGRDQQSIIGMCQNNIHQPFLKHVRSTQASSRRGNRDMVVCFETGLPTHRVLGWREVCCASARARHLQLGAPEPLVWAEQGQQNPPGTQKRAPQALVNWWSSSAVTAKQMQWQHFADIPPSFLQPGIDRLFQFPLTWCT